MKSRMLIFLIVLINGITAMAQIKSDKTSNPIAVQILKENSLRELLKGPNKPEDLADWLAGMRSYRQEMRLLMEKKSPGFSDPYTEPALQWAQRSFIQPLMMAHDRYFYDPVAGQYTVQYYLQDLTSRYGGIESVLIWPTYPNIGIDNRNQFDLWRDMPGGITGLRRMVEEFHKQGVRVILPIMYWDHGTQDEGMPMEQRMAELAREIGADGLNGDTMSPIGSEFYSESLKAGHPLALEPENGLKDRDDALLWNVMSWGYWWPYQPQPAVDRYKFIDPRHLTHVCDRWAHDRTDMLQYAFFNGSGYQSWENVWGIWNRVSPRDGEALRRISAIYRTVPELLTSTGYEPFTPTLNNGVYATKFPGKNMTLWTLINRTSDPKTGAQLIVPYFPGDRYFDLWNGSELKAQITNKMATLSFNLESHGYGSVLVINGSPADQVKKLLEAMKLRENTAIASLSAEWKVLPQKIVEIVNTNPASHNYEGMILIPSGKYLFEAEGVMIEKGEGVDIQYPWEDKPVLKHEHELKINSFYIDKTPVMCADFKRFIDANAYHPVDSHNFLRNWINGSYPEGWANKPVTWISLEDARAYAKWAGKRLPHEWEWQYAAQGTDGRLYPWGNEMDSTRIPPYERGREQQPPTDVDAYPQGASPFGVLDMVGNVWQWTDEFTDDHTRAAILKGGSYYRPSESDWYFPQIRQLNQHGKYLLMASSIDRSASIGFRCVADAE